MDIIDIYVKRSLKTYPSAASAIAAVEGLSKQSLAKADSSKLAERSFVGAKCSHDSWCLEFSGGVWLRIACEDAGVLWHVTGGEIDCDWPNHPYTLKWPSGETTIIDPDKLLSGRTGALFWQLYVTEAGLSVYLRGQPILAFHAVSRVDGGANLLHVAELD